MRVMLAADGGEDGEEVRVRHRVGVDRRGVKHAVVLGEDGRGR